MSLVDVAVYNSALYVSALIDTSKGVELYKYDGTNVSLVADLRPGSNSSYPNEMKVFKGSLYMNVNNGVNGEEVYRIASPNSVQNVFWSGTVLVSPNPATTGAVLDVRLKAAESLSISLTDMSGKTIFNSGIVSFNAGEHRIKLPVQALASGQYCYRVSGVAGNTLAAGTFLKD